MADRISTTPDMHEGYPDEWQTLENVSTGDGIRVVEWNAVTDQVRITGPMIEVSWPVRPL